MPRVAGTYRTATVGGEKVRAYLPHPLPPANPPFELSGSLTSLVSEGTAALGRLTIAGQMVPLDGNGRIGRLLIALLLQHWDLLPAPLLYLSLAFKRHQSEYYQRLSAVRTDGDWEGWTEFFLECVREAADDGVTTAQRLFACMNRDRQTLLSHPRATIPAIRLFDLLPEHPVVTMTTVMTLLQTTKPTATKAIDSLRQAHLLHETTGRLRDRVYAYRGYLQILTKDTE